MTKKKKIKKKNQPFFSPPTPPPPKKKQHSLFHKLVFRNIFFFHKVQNVSPGIANKYVERLSMITSLTAKDQSTEMHKTCYHLSLISATSNIVGQLNLMKFIYMIFLC